MKINSNERITTILRAFTAALAVSLIAASMLVFLAAVAAGGFIEPCYAGSVTYNDDEKKDLDNPGDVYTVTYSHHLG